MSIFQGIRRFILLLGLVLLAGQALAQPEPGNPVHQAPAPAAATAGAAPSPEVEALLKILQENNDPRLDQDAFDRSPYLVKKQRRAAK